MTLRYDPFISLTYNESYGTIGWNTWNDENILKLAVLGSPFVDAVTIYPVGSILNGTWSLDGGVTLNGQGSAVANGVKVIIGSPGQGVFSGKEGQIAAIVDNTFKFYQPTEGMVFYNKDTGAVLEYRDSSWADVDDFGSLLI